MPSTTRRRVLDRVPPLLRQTAFRRYWTAQSISYLGDQITFVALPLAAVLALDANASQLGVLSAAASLPNLLFSLHAGSLIDRSGRLRATMVVADLVRALVLVTVPIAYWLDVMTLPQLYVVAFVTGTFGMLFSLCANSLLAVVVPREQLLSGNALVKGSYNFSFAAGPGIGGGLVQLLSGPVAIVLDVASFLGSALLLRSLSSDEPRPAPAGRRHLREGLRFVLRTPVLLAKFFADASLNFFYTIYFTLLVLYAVQELHLSSGLVGVVIAAGAIGAMAGAALTTRASRSLGVGGAFFLGAFLYPGALVLVPLAHGPVWLAATVLIVAEFVSGIGLMVCDISATSIQLALTPHRLRARVQGAFMLFNKGSRPLGALVGGALGSWLGLRPTLWLATLGGVVSILFILPSPLRRMKELPAEAE
ncbi:MFS transporter [Streptomyces sp. NPDC053474]|uniref:MFS transporter n=1 Tax=Streptomyces sp. NPDC053474 TaxID=3365704 RepID=UPI0037D7C54B